MATVSVQSDSRGFVYRAIKGLIADGWRLAQVPDRGRLGYNGQEITLQRGSTTSRLRLFVYKVGTSGRGRTAERRLEITRTYGGGLTRIPGVRDIVIGYSDEFDAFVGVDPRRLSAGGATHNASTFVDRNGLASASARSIRVLPRSSDLYSSEFQAFFKARLVADYMLNVATIHGGKFVATAKSARATKVTAGRLQVPLANASGSRIIATAPALQPQPAPKPPTRQLRAYERREFQVPALRRITPERLAEIKTRCDENGLLGEKHVFDSERRRLRKVGKGDLADKVRWISQESVCAGYDILSYESDGTKRHIEVKSMETTRDTFEMSSNEWAKAIEHGERYVVAVVRNVRDDPEIELLRNPVALETGGYIAKTASAWRVNLNP